MSRPAGKRFATKLILFASGVLALCAPAVSEPLFWGDLRSGPHPVGFTTRRLPDGELHVWYPAVAVNGDAMLFGDYLRLSSDLMGAIEGFATDDDALQRSLALAITGEEDGLTGEKAEQVLRTPMEARRDAVAAAGKFPLVLWTHRYGATSAQSVISEYLASHGMVVVYRAEAKVPLMPFALESEADKKAELARQLTRLKAALDTAQQLPFVLRGRVGVMAWSYAGESAYALQQAEPQVAVVVALSSNTLSGWVYSPDSLANLTPATLTAPYVLITEPRTDGSATPGEMLLRNASAPIFVVSMPKMKHGAFNALEGMIPAVAGISTVRKWSLAGAEAKLGYETAAQYARRALAHYLVAVRTQDEPFALWRPEGDIEEGFVAVQTGGTPRPQPEQPGFQPVEFKSGDGLMVSADLYPLVDKKAPIIVLVHQSGASRGEYRQIAPRLNAMGFNALAIDSRWGKVDRWNGIENLTARRYGTAEIVASGDRARIRAIDREVDLRAAVRWVTEEGYSGPLILWGSSITANGVLTLASAGEQVVAGLLAFSPGEYNEQNTTEMQTKVKRLTVPLLIACGEAEEQLCRGIYEAVPEGKKRFYRAARGRHGSSILLDDPQNWEPVVSFLKRYGASAPSGGAGFQGG
jgi:dienelactone hydrolase